MQYTISMTSRMLAITVLCAFLLCVLLFLLGIELGKRFAEPPPTPAAPVASVAAPALPAVPAAPAAPALPAAPAPVLKP
jgi:O-antigen/teichoic acid export membrane protein